MKVLLMILVSLMPVFSLVTIYHLLTNGTMATALPDSHMIVYVNPNWKNIKKTIKENKLGLS